MPARARHLLALVVTVLVLALSGQAAALAPVGSVLADFTAHDPDDRPVRLHSLRGRPTVLFYEDKEARDQNDALKGRLVTMIRADGLARKLNFFGVADVERWNFWPARGFVKDELRAQRARYGLPVYADWVGGARAKLGARPGRSNIVVLDATGKVLWSSEGKLDPGRERALFGRIKGAAAPARADAGPRRPRGAGPGPARKARAS